MCFIDPRVPTWREIKPTGRGVVHATNSTANRKRFCFYCSHILYYLYSVRVIVHYLYCTRLRSLSQLRTSPPSWCRGDTCPASARARTNNTMIIQYTYYYCYYDGRRCDTYVPMRHASFRLDSHFVASRQYRFSGVENIERLKPITTNITFVLCIVEYHYLCS